MAGNELLPPMGPAEVWIGGSSVARCVGGVKFKDEPNMAEIKEDITGDTPIGMVVTGQKVFLEANFTNASVTELETIIMGATQDAQGNLVVYSQVGRNIADDAQEIELRPVVNGEVITDVTKHIILLKAAMYSKLDLDFSVGNQKVFAVTIQCFPVDLSGKMAFYKIGNTPAV